MAGEQIILIFPEVQGDGGAALRFFNHGYAELAAAIRLPGNALIGIFAGAAGCHHDFVSHDKGRIEADPELADQPRILLLVAA